MPDKEMYDDALQKFECIFETDDVFEEYLRFSQFIQGLFISSSGYIIDTGNFRNANLEMMHRIKEKVEHHPLMWKLLFMIA